MQLKELRDMFVASYHTESLKQKFEPIDFPDSLVYLWITQAKNDLFRRLKILTTFIDITIPLGENTFQLPYDFGSEISCEASGIKLEKTSIEEMQTTGTASGNICKYAIFNNQDGYNITFSPNAIQAANVRIFYNISQAIYSPSAQNQAFIKGKFKGILNIPDEYLQCVLYFMLSQSVGSEFMQLFESEITKQRQLLNSLPLAEKLTYKMD